MAAMFGMTMATNMMMHPIVSRVLILSWSRSEDATTANTDSMHMIRDAMADSVYFCPMI